MKSDDQKVPQQAEAKRDNKHSKGNTDAWK